MLLNLNKGMIVLIGKGKQTKNEVKNILEKKKKKNMKKKIKKKMKQNKNNTIHILQVYNHQILICSV